MYTESSHTHITCHVDGRSLYDRQRQDVPGNELFAFSGKADRFIDFLKELNEKLTCSFVDAASWESQQIQDALQELTENMAHCYRARTLSTLTAEYKHDFERLSSFGGTKVNIEVNMEEQNNIKFCICQR